ncbi:hypothetical protein JTB14_031096 [Gonioctena quinquepunctata]|nr:hypothetical protein JTB14_031096 [Gonioctena quinquepunctata]
MTNRKHSKQKKSPQKKLKKLLECNLSPIRVSQPTELPLTPRGIGPASPLIPENGNYSFPDSPTPPIDRPPTPGTPEHLKRFRALQ